MLVKVIVVPRDDIGAQREYKHLISEIVSATNWQNAIKQTDLKSNDVEQVRLERDFHKIGYQYLRKRMTKSEARRVSGSRYKMQVKKQELAQSVAACLFDPYEVRLGKDRLFEDDLYSKIFDGRPTPDYLTFVRLHKFVRYCSRSDKRKGRAKWLVLNFLWSQLGSRVNNRNGVRDKLLHVSERENKYASQCALLYRAIGSLFKVAMAFYRANKTTDLGVLDESTFFKHRNRHREFAVYWNSRKNAANARSLKGQLARFVTLLQSVEMH